MKQKGAYKFAHELAERNIPYWIRCAWAGHILCACHCMWCFLTLLSHEVNHS
jgi:hypothetical protein